MFAAKCNGFTELPGIGRLSWQELVALADVILGTFWNEPGNEERIEVLTRVIIIFNWIDSLRATAMTAATEVLHCSPGSSIDGLTVRVLP